MDERARETVGEATSSVFRYAAPEWPPLGSITSNGETVSSRHRCGSTDRDPARSPASHRQPRYRTPAERQVLVPERPPVPSSCRMCRKEVVTGRGVGRGEVRHGRAPRIAAMPSGSGARNSRRTMIEGLSSSEA